MDKLNELKAIAMQFESHDVKPMPVYPEDILDIAEAFRELEQRAEAAWAEAKHQLGVNVVLSRHNQEVIAQRDKALSHLSELAKQEPYGYVAESPCSSGYGGMMYEFSIDRCDAEHDANQAEGFVIELFTRPAPAAVPVDDEVLKNIAVVAHHGGLANLDASKAINLVRRLTLPYVDTSIGDDEILRRIEELK